MKKSRAKTLGGEGERGFSFKPAKQGGAGAYNSLT